MSQARRPQSRRHRLSRWGLEQLSDELRWRAELQFQDLQDELVQRDTVHLRQLCGSPAVVEV